MIKEVPDSMNTNFNFDGEWNIRKNDLIKISSSVYEVLKQELPDDRQNYFTFSVVLKECIDYLKYIDFKLE